MDIDYGYSLKEEISFPCLVRFALKSLFKNLKSIDTSVLAVSLPVDLQRLFIESIPLNNVRDFPIRWICKVLRETKFIELIEEDEERGISGLNDVGAITLACCMLNTRISAAPRCLRLLNEWGTFKILEFMYDSDGIGVDEFIEFLCSKHSHRFLKSDFTQIRLICYVRTNRVHDVLALFAANRGKHAIKFSYISECIRHFCKDDTINESIFLKLCREAGEGNYDISYWTLFHFYIDVLRICILKYENIFELVFEMFMDFVFLSSNPKLMYENIWTNIVGFIIQTPNRRRLFDYMLQEIMPRIKIGFDARIIATAFHALDEYAISELIRIYGMNLSSSWYFLRALERQNPYDSREIRFAIDEREFVLLEKFGYRWTLEELSIKFSEFACFRKTFTNNEVMTLNIILKYGMGGNTEMVEKYLEKPSCAPRVRRFLRSWVKKNKV